MVEQLQSLTELAHQINLALVKAGCAGLRREFNEKLWACNRERALALIVEYRKALVNSLVSTGSGDLAASLSTPLK